MIFVTVGHQMPFDRLIEYVDTWAGQRGRRDVFAQIGNANYVPQHIEWANQISSDQFMDKSSTADFLVAHAGTGTILTALEFGKPIVVMPRSARLRETRNDHQTATAERFAALGYVHFARDEPQLWAVLDAPDTLKMDNELPPKGSLELVQEIRSFIHGPPSV